jgi:hypothetical protein
MLSRRLPFRGEELLLSCIADSKGREMFGLVARCFVESSRRMRASVLRIVDRNAECQLNPDTQQAIKSIP